MIYTSENIQKKKRRKDRTKKVIKIIIYIIIIPLLCYNISLIVQAVVNPEETPSFFGIKTYVIISGSMEPSLNIGDMIIVKKVEIEELEEGDIISFRQGQSIITHRIVEIIEEEGKIEFKTKGDSNNAEDSGTITEELIEGKVVSVVPIVGKISVLLQNKIIIITILLIAYIYFMYTGKRQKRRRERHIDRIRYEYERNETGKSEEQAQK